VARARGGRPARAKASKALETARPTPADPVTEEFVDALIDRYRETLEELAKL
jgi:hypothetical protein